MNIALVYNSIIPHIDDTDVAIDYCLFLSICKLLVVNRLKRHKIKDILKTVNPHKCNCLRHSFKTNILTDYPNLHLECLK